MFRSILRRWADAGLLAENARLNQKILALESQHCIAELELKELAAVIARNIRRVEAETAAAARQIVTPG
jgi:hypothetical protein